MHPGWPLDLRDQCRRTPFGVPFLFKQWGEWRRWAPGDGAKIIRHVSARDGKHGEHPGHVDGERSIRGDTAPMSLIGKARAGRELGGRTYSEFPA